MLPRIRRSVFCLVAGMLVGCQQLPRLDESGRHPFAVVAMPDAFSAEASEAVLREGGNAVDATVAAAFVLAVTYPEAGNVGGGGFMLAHVDGDDHFLDYREVAPAAAHRDMYLDDQGDVVEGLSLVGALAAGVPGTVAGLWEAHQRFGTLPWERLIQPAVELARDGFIVPDQLPERIEDERAAFAETTNFDVYFGRVVAGERFIQNELAATLQAIASGGREGFYGGTVASQIADTSKAYGGLLTERDLAAYRPVWRKPLRQSWRGHVILSAPPPSSGGFAVVQLLKMKDELADAFEDVPFHSTRYIHLIAEMEKRVFADRAEYLGDPDFHDVPMDELLADSYIARRAAAVNVDAISQVAASPPGLEPRHTTHFSIVDGWGNAVSNTYTLNTSFGSGLVVEGGGFLLNNEMDDFSAKPGVPNFYGVVGQSANAIEPGKRMLSSMSPTILLRGGEPLMILGTPGGSTIFTSVFQTIVNVLDFGMTPQEAVSQTRFHHQLLPPDLITFSPDRPLPTPAVAGLEDLGYRIEPHGWDFGDVQVIYLPERGPSGGSDPRGRGEWRVIELHEMMR